MWWNKMFFIYLKNRVSYILWLILFSAIFGMLTYLYGMPLAGVLYSILLCVSIFVMVGIFDFIYFYKKQKQLVLMEKAIVHDQSSLPPPTSTAEEEYQKLLAVMHQALSELATKNSVQNHEMKDFYSLWVHQIKTPISAMSLLLQEDNSPHSSVLMQELFKIERYTELVLTYLKIDDISSDLSFHQCSLEEIVRQAVKKYAPIFISKNISITLTHLDQSILTDDKWLTFCVEQLVSNALKYTPQNGNVHIYTQNETTLVIEDNGIGIAPEDLPRIFEKGFTGYNGHMDKKATGLGLYLIKKTLDKLGHPISISSAQSGGVTAKINLYREKRIIE